jgi:hypothetical protein
MWARLRARPQIRKFTIDIPAATTSRSCLCRSSAGQDRTLASPRDGGLVRRLASVNSGQVERGKHTGRMATCRVDDDQCVSSCLAISWAAWSRRSSEETFRTSVTAASPAVPSVPAAAAATTSRAETMPHARRPGPTSATATACTRCSAIKRATARRGVPGSHVRMPAWIASWTRTWAREIPGALLIFAS